MTHLLAQRRAFAGPVLPSHGYCNLIATPLTSLRKPELSQFYLNVTNPRGGEGVSESGFRIPCCTVPVSLLCGLNTCAAQGTPREKMDPEELSS